MEDITSKHPHDIAEQIAALSPEEQTIAFLLLPGTLEGEVFGKIEPYEKWSRAKLFTQSF